MSYRFALLSLITCCACGADVTVSAAETTATAELKGCGLESNADPLALLLASADPCPTNVTAFRALLGAAGAKLAPTMVANRGFHNSAAGSFSFFEMVTGDLAAPGDFFFGHFTERDDSGALTLADRPDDGALMIELIAWDGAKGAYNFYELIGDGTRGVWHYRGDSFDIFADNAKMHLQSTAQFGSRLRCSGCHQGGGPIMKELAPPHNDWWTKARPLPFGAASSKLLPIANALVDAQELTKAVSVGQARVARPADLQQALRPLFCPEEVNFVSATGAADVPSEWIVDPRLASAVLSTPHYSAALVSLGMHFPETTRRDGDHGWLAPVKAAADVAAVDALLAAGVVDDEFVADVLAVDLSRPAISPSRCGLLRLVPKSSVGWRSAFEAALAASTDPAATELLANLTDATHTADAHSVRAAALLSACAAKLSTASGTRDLLGVLTSRRQAIKASQISKNPRGQILEPGFRVIFAVPATPPPVDAPLDDHCAP